MFGRNSDSDEAEQIDFECEKCGATEAETSEIATAGSKMQKMLNVQSQKFHVVYCQECGYAEFYHEDSSRLGDIADLAFG